MEHWAKIGLVVLLVVLLVLMAWLCASRAIQTIGGGARRAMTKRSNPVPQTRGVFLMHAVTGYKTDVLGILKDGHLRPGMGDAALVDNYFNIVTPQYPIPPHGKAAGSQRTAGTVTASAKPIWSGCWRPGPGTPRVSAATDLPQVLWTALVTKCPSLATCHYVTTFGTSGPQAPQTQR
jgi:hypothetical protein